MNRVAFTLVLSVVCCAPNLSFGFGDGCGDHSIAIKTDTAFDSGVEIDSRAFFALAKGNYVVLKAGGIPPHEGTTGAVEVEDQQVVLAFSFCPPSGGCDPNYVFMDLPKTKINQKAANDGSTSFTIVSEDGGKPTRFTWDVSKDGMITLKNYQYILGGKIVTLEHVMKKI